MNRGSTLRGLLRDLRRRHVFRTAGAYVVVTWIVFQVASETYEALNLPDWTPVLVLVLAVLGIPLALVLAWAYDITPDGVQRTPDSPEKWSRTQRLLEFALELPEGERLAYIRGAAGSDRELLNETIALLEAHGRPGPLDRPATHVIGVSPGRVPLAPTPGQMVAHYEILQELGDGGMGIVYRARDVRLQRVVALKFLPPHLSRDREAKQRMLSEAQAAASLDHPHVCTLLEIGEVDDQIFLAMPCYDGETLKHRLARGRLPLAEALDLAVQAASGLTAAHAKGIIHRDIKPANLIITSDGVLKILDFGIAKLADVAATTPGQTPGTLAYMSPEQARGGHVDARSDVWSLGVVLYESLAGRRPFSDTDAMPAALTVSDPEPLSGYRTDVPAAVDAVLRRALAVDPDRRYRSGAELHEALTGLLAGFTGRRSASEAADDYMSDPVNTELPPEGERRQATVVVSIVGGYAELVESASHEQVRTALSRVRGAADEIAERFGGRLNSFEDDRMELLFGVPVSHEDHCFRGIRAALELHERVRAIEVPGAHALKPLALHTGVDTGQVLAQPAPAAGRLRLIGDPVRAAARLQAHASTDELWITGACHRVVGAFFETEARDPLPHGGGAFDRLHRVLRLSGMRTRMEAARLVGLTRYVGREVELAHLRDAVTKARAGRGQAVTIHGEAGVGKSRLLHEFRQSPDMVDVTFLEGRCQSFGGGVAYLPFIDVLRAAVGAERGGSADRALAVAEAVRTIGSDLEAFIPLYLHLLSLPHSSHPLPPHLHGEALRHAMQEALAALVTLFARTRPVVLLLEDWHWADDASGAALRQILEVGADHSLLVVVTSRSYSPQTDLTRLTVLPLEPLGADAGADMLRTVLGAVAVPADLAERVHSRTGGNPFFIEEIGRALVEEGALTVTNGVVTPVGDVRALHLPETVEAVIRGRLDRLDRDTREIARLASAVGREFERHLLEQAMHSGSRLPHALQTLKSAGLVQQIRVVPDAAYRFNHALTQEVAYGSLLERQRIDVHGRVAEAIERVYAQSLEEHYTRLADHFGRAGSWRRAVHYGVRAADRLMGLSAFTDALEQLERCEEWIARLADDNSESLIEVLLRQERLCETLGMRARQQQLIDRLIGLLENTDDRRLLAETFIRQGDLFTLLRRFTDAERVLLESLRLNRASGDPDAVRNSLRSLGLMCWHADRPHDAVTFIEETLQIDRQHHDDDALVGDLSNFGAVLKGMGQPERARTVLEEALAMIDAGRVSVQGGGSSLKECYILHNLANVHMLSGETEVAQEYLERATMLTELDQLPVQYSYHFTSLAHLALQQGRVEESLGYYQQAVAVSRRARFTPGLSQALRMLGEVLMGLGRDEEALPCLEEAAGLFAQLEDTASEARLWRQIALTHQRHGAAGSALAAWRRVAALAGDTDDEAALEAAVGVALAGKQAGRPPDEVRRAHMDALDRAAAAGAAAKQGQLLNNLGILAWENSDYAEALIRFEAGLLIYRTLDDAEGLGLMLNSIAATLKAMHRYDEAREYLNEAMRVHRDAGNGRLEGHAAALLGDMEMDQGRADRALPFFTRSLSLRHITDDHVGAGWMHSRIAAAHIALAQPERAVEHIAAARRIADEYADRDLMNACGQLVSANSTC